MRRYVGRDLSVTSRRPLLLHTGYPASIRLNRRITVRINLRSAGSETLAEPPGQLGVVRYFNGTHLLIARCRSGREDDNKGYWTSHAQTNKSVNERYAAGYAWIYSRSVLYPRWPLSSSPVNESRRVAVYLLLQAGFSGSGYFVCFSFSDLPPAISLHGDPSRHLPWTAVSLLFVCTSPHAV